MSTPTFEDFIRKLERELRKDVPAGKVLRKVVRDFKFLFDEELEAGRVAKPEPPKEVKINPFRDDDIPF